MMKANYLGAQGDQAVLLLLYQCIHDTGSTSPTFPFIVLGGTMFLEQGYIHAFSTIIGCVCYCIYVLPDYAGATKIQAINYHNILPRPDNDMHLDQLEYAALEIRIS